MSFGRRFGLVAALENEDMDLPVEGEVVEAADSAESAMLEMNEAASGVDEGLDTAEQVSSDAEQLDAIADTMEASEENGGLDETSAAIAEVAVEAIYARLGVTRRKPLPAMESFGSASTRLRSTKLAVEGIREMASKAWAAVVAIWEKVKAFFVKLWKWVTDSNFRNKARAEKMATRLKTVKGDPKEAKIEAEAISKALSIRGTFNPAGLAKELDSLGDAVKIPESELTFVSETIATFVAAIGDAKKFAEYSPDWNFGSEAKTTSKAPEGYKFVTYGGGKTVDMLGGLRIYKQIPNKSLAGEEAWRADFKVIVEQTDTAGAAGKEVATAPKATLEAIVKSVIGLCDSVDANRGVATRIEKMTDEIIKKAKEAAKAAKDDDATKRSKAVQVCVRNSTSILIKGPSTLMSQGVKASKASLDYVEKSLKTFDASKAAETPITDGQ